MKWCGKQAVSGVIVVNCCASCGKCVSYVVVSSFLALLLNVYREVGDRPKLGGAPPPLHTLRRESVQELSVDVVNLADELAHFTPPPLHEPRPVF